jgi:hypothetical protein
MTEIEKGKRRSKAADKKGGRAEGGWRTAGCTFLFSFLIVLAVRQFCLPEWLSADV